MDDGGLLQQGMCSKQPDQPLTWSQPHPLSRFRSSGVKSL